MKRQNQRKVVLSKQPGVRDRKRLITVSTAHDQRRGQQSIYQQLNQRPDDHHSILVIRSLGGIGDVLMTTPAVRQLKEDFPNSHITYATDRHSTQEDMYYQLLKNAPFIDTIADARRTTKQLFTAWVDITSCCIKYENGNLPPLNRIDIFARACGIPKLRNPVPFYQVSPEEQIVAATKLQSYRNNKLVFLHTASVDAKRCWPSFRYVELIEQARKSLPYVKFLVSDYNNVLSNKASYTNCVDVTSPSIRDVAAIIGASDLFVGPDSGPMHIAGALGIPSLVMFGSIPPKARLNYYLSSKSIEPVHYACGTPHCFYKKCNYNVRCMSDITSEQVLRMIKENI